MFVAYSHDAIKDSPSPAAAEGLTTEEEAELSRYYGTERYAPSAPCANGDREFGVARHLAGGPHQPV